MEEIDEIDYEFAIRFWENQLTEQLKEIQTLKAEIVYWKETANNWKELYKETDSGLQYWKSHSSKLAETLNNLNKRVDK